MKRMGFRANLPTNQKVGGGTIHPQTLNRHCFMWCAKSWRLLVFILLFQDFYKSFFMPQNGSLSYTPNTKTCNTSNSVCFGFHHKTSKTTDKYIEKNSLDFGQGCGSTLTHRQVPAKAGQAVPTTQGPIYYGQFFYLQCSLIRSLAYSAPFSSAIFQFSQARFLSFKLK